MLVNIIILELKLKTKVSSYQMYHLVLHRNGHCLKVSENLVYGTMNRNFPII